MIASEYDVRLIDLTLVPVELMLMLILAVGRNHSVVLIAAEEIKLSEEMM